MIYQKDYTVDIPQHSHLEYREGNKMMKVGMDFKDTVPLLSYQSIERWEPPHGADLISPDAKCQILKNIIYFLFEVRKFKFEVEGGGLVESRKYIP